MFNVLGQPIDGKPAPECGEMDAYPEAAFYNVGTLDDVKKKAAELK